MCRDAPDLCANDREPGAGPFVLSSGDAANMRAVNASVNRAIRPTPDTRDEWSVHSAVGDCEDFALTKRAELMAQGWAASQLLIAVVDAPGVGAHAVLIARTDQGDLVLDNLTDRILPWDRTGLSFRSRQSEKLPAMWVKL